MNKTTHFLLGTLFLLASCNENISESIRPETKKRTESGNPYFRNYEAALDIAKKQIFGSETRTVSIPKVREHYVYKPSPLTRNVTDTVDVAFHVINFENEQGFAIISADKRAVPVYAYSEEGNINLYDAVEESGWGYFMDMAEKHYTSTLALDLPPFINPQDSAIGGPNYGDIPQLAIDYLNGVRCRVRTTDTYYNYGTRLSTLWDQCSPYNYYYPQVSNGYHYNDYKNDTGCTPIAIAQIMAYYQYPESYNGHIYNWDEITSKGHYSLQEYTQASLNTAQLIYDIAVLADTDIYNTSATPFNNVKGVFNNMGYQATAASFSTEKVINSIHDNKPIYIRGSRQNEIGHAWIIDEHRHKESTTTYYYDEPPYDIYYEGSNTYHYFHCNWGWGEGGNSTAYCLNVFEAPSGYTYSQSPKIVYNISPNV